MISHLTHFEQILKNILVDRMCLIGNQELDRVSILHGTHVIITSFMSIHVDSFTECLHLLIFIVTV